MNTGDIIVFVIIIIATIMLFVLSLLQKLHKGKPLNYKYLYVSEEKRKTLNLDALYKQSSTVLFMLGLLMIFVLLSSILDSQIFFYLDLVLILVTAGYLIYTDAIMNKNDEEDNDKK